MRNGTPPIASFARTLDMLDAVIADGGQSGIAAIARSIGMPVATAHRQVATLALAGFLKAGANGRFVPGPRLLGLLHRLDAKQVITSAAAPVLHRLAAEVRSVVQLGTLENDMVTYRIKTGRGAGSLFTKVGMQLEAYCSGIGKVLLANLPDPQLRAYMQAGPFVALTARTITDPAKLAQELQRVRQQGYAVDDGEIAEGLLCLAMPIRTPDGSVLAAISISKAAPHADALSPDELLPVLAAAAAEIETIAFAPR